MNKQSTNNEEKRLGYVSIKILEQSIEKTQTHIREDFNPKDFFTNRVGLHVYDSFTEKIVEPATKENRGSELSFQAFDIVKASEDEMIELALPDAHIFSENDVCVLLANLISEQSKGEKGKLLSNVYWNLFYTPHFVVAVDWYGDEWSVSAWTRDSSRWRAGYRVFSPATDR